MRYIKSKNLKKISRIELSKEFISSYEGSLEKKFTFNYISLVNILSSSFDRFSMVSRVKKMKIENWNSSMIEKIKKKKKKRKDADKILRLTLLSFLLHHAESGSIRRLCRDSASVHPTSVLLESLSGFVVVLFHKSPKTFRGCAGMRPYFRMHVVSGKRNHALYNFISTSI